MKWLRLFHGADLGGAASVRLNEGVRDVVIVEDGRVPPTSAWLTAAASDSDGGWLFVDGVVPSACVHVGGLSKAWRATCRSPVHVERNQPNGTSILVRNINRLLFASLRPSPSHGVCENLMQNVEDGYVMRVVMIRCC